MLHSVNGSDHLVLYLYLNKYGHRELPNVHVLHNARHLYKLKADLIQMQVSSYFEYFEFHLGCRDSALLNKIFLQIFLQIVRLLFLLLPNHLLTFFQLLRPSNNLKGKLNLHYFLLEDLNLFLDDNKNHQDIHELQVSLNFDSLYNFVLTRQDGYSPNLLLVAVFCQIYFLPQHMFRIQ